MDDLLTKNLNLGIKCTFNESLKLLFHLDQAAIMRPDLHRITNLNKKHTNENQMAFI